MRLLPLPDRRTDRQTTTERPEFDLQNKPGQPNKYDDRNESNVHILDLMGAHSFSFVVSIEILSVPATSITGAVQASVERSSKLKT